MTTVLDIVKNNQLVPDETWKKFISSLATSFDKLETNNHRAHHRLTSVLIEAVQKRLGQKMGIFFSGGVDSSTLSLITKKLGIAPLCYSVGLEGSDDLAWAQKIAAEYQFILKHRSLSLDELESVLKKVIEVTKSADMVTVSVGCVTYCAAQLAKEDGCNAVMSGLGSEELFAGYDRHLKVLDLGYETVHTECICGLQHMRQRDLVRDFSITQHFHQDLLMPFLDRELIKTALGFHPMLKLDKTGNKLILREVGQHLGLHREFAYRKKQAAQYGSSVVWGIEKLAKRNGFSLKREYLQSLFKGS